MKKIQRFISALMIFVFLFAAYPLSHAADFTSWAKKMPVTFSGYSKSSTLTNFPALVVLSTNISGFSYADFADSSGGDLRFADSTETNELNYEIEGWDTNGSSYVWVQVPTLSGTATVINAYWGKSGVGAPAYTTNGATWESDYDGVWHMDATNPPNSVAGGVDGTKSGTVTVGTGMVGSALDFENDTTADYVNVDGTGQQDPDVLSVSCWMKLDTGGGEGVLYGHRDEATRLVQLTIQSSSQAQLQLRSSGNSLQQAVKAGLDLTAWTHLACVFDNAGGDEHFLYVNGICAATNTYDFGTETFTSTKQTIGTFYNTGYQDGVEGLIDEMRVSSAVRSADWIWAEWMNMASNSVFSSYGTAAVQAKRGSFYTF